MKIRSSQMSLFVLIVLMAVAITPLCERYYKGMIGSVAMVWFFSYFIYTCRCLSKDSFIYLLFLTYIFGLKFIGFSTASIGNYIGIMVTVVTMVSYDYIVMQEKESIKITAIVGMLIIFINIASSIYSTFKYPEIQDYVTNSQYFIDTYGMTNVFSTLDAVVLLFAVIVIVIGYQCFGNIRIEKTLMILLCIYVIFFQLKRTTAILILFFSILVLLLMSIQKKLDKKSKQIISLLICLIAIILLLSWNSFWNYIAQFVSDKNIRIRLQSLAEIFSFSMENTNFSGNSLLQRMHMFFLDIQYWLSGLKTFIFGNGYHRDLYGATSIDNAIINKSSGHTSFGDILAQYGIFGAVFLIVFFRHVKKLYGWALAGCAEKDKYLKFLSVVILLLSITNEFFSPEIAVTILVLFPCYLKEENNRSNERVHE